MQLLLVHSGGVEALLEGEAHKLTPPAAIIVPALAVHGFRFLPGTKGVVLTLSHDIVARDPLMLPGLLGTPRGERLSGALIRRLVSLSAEMLRVQSERRPGHQGIALALAEALVRLVGQAMDMAADPRPPAPVAERLRALIEMHFREHHPIAFYAAALSMTERTMARLCKAQFGCSPQILIHRRLAMEATRLLRYSNAQIAQIAEELGFADPSYFSRFYQRMTGQRPMAARSPAIAEHPS